MSNFSLEEIESSHVRKDDDAANIWLIGNDPSLGIAEVEHGRRFKLITVVLEMFRSCKIFTTRKS